MTCDQIYELLSAKLDGALTDAEQTQLQAHLDACEDCRRLYDAMFSIEVQTKALEQPAPEGLKRGVMYRIRQETGAVKTRKRRFWGVGTGLGLAAAVLVMMVGAGIIRVPKPVRSQTRTEDQSAWQESAPAESVHAGTAAPDDDRFLPAPARTENAGEPVKGLKPDSPAGQDDRPEAPSVPAEDGTTDGQPPQSTGPVFEDNNSFTPQSPPTEELDGTRPDGDNAAESPVAVTQPHVGGDTPLPGADPEDQTPVRPGEPITEALNEACMALSLQSEAPVLLYTEFSWPSLMVLLEEAEPELFEALAGLEPCTVDEALALSEGPDPDPEPGDPTAETVAPPVVPDSAMPALPDGIAPEELPPEERMLVCPVDWQTALALHEWLLRMLPRTEGMDLEELMSEASTCIRLEELDPEHGSLNRIVTWDHPTGPVGWPEFWAEGWPSRFRKSENWALFFPEEEYLPAPEDPAWLILLIPTEPEPVEFPCVEEETLQPAG